MSMPDFLRERLIALQQQDEQLALERRAREADVRAQASARQSQQEAAQRAAQLEQAKALQRVAETALYLGPLLGARSRRFVQTSIVHRRNRFGTLKPLGSGARLVYKYTEARRGTPSLSAQRDGLYTEGTPALPSRASGVLLTAEGELKAYNITDAQQPKEDYIVVPHKVLPEEFATYGNGEVPIGDVWIPGANQMESMMERIILRNFGVPPQGQS